MKDLKNQKIFKNFAAIETKVADSEPRTLVVKISTPNPDRSKDTVQPNGMLADNFLKNPVVMFAHNYADMPIAKCTGLKIQDTGILATVQFPDEGTYDKADTIYKMYKEGFLNAWSIGFMPLDYEENEQGGYNFKSWELFEFSSVPVPDNPEALTIMRSKGINVDAVLEKNNNSEKETEEQDSEESNELPGDTPITAITVGDLRDIIEDVLENSDVDDNDEDEIKATDKVIEKDVNEVLALSYVLDCLNYFISYFKDNDVSQASIDKLTQALALVLEVTKEQAELGKKEFTVVHSESDTDESTNNDTGENKDVEKNLNSNSAFLQKLANSLKTNNQKQDLTLRLLKEIRSGTGGEKK